MPRNSVLMDVDGSNQLTAPGVMCRSCGSFQNGMVQSDGQGSPALALATHDGCQRLLQHQRNQLRCSASGYVAQYVLLPCWKLCCVDVPTQAAVSSKQMHMCFMKRGWNMLACLIGLMVAAYQ